MMGKNEMVWDSKKNSKQEQSVGRTRSTLARGPQVTQGGRETSEGVHVVWWEGALQGAGWVSVPFVPNGSLNRTVTPFPIGSAFCEIGSGGMGQRGGEIQWSF